MLPSFIHISGIPQENTASKIIVMSSNFRPSVSIEAINSAHAAGNEEVLFDLLVQPLHEELYKRQTFDFLDDLTWGQQLLLSYDYLHMQAGQGGFIQFLHNGYVGLMPSIVEQLNKLGANDMAIVLDDALKVYVLNRELLEGAQSVEEFARLYDELKEFEGIDERYRNLNKATTTQLLNYAVTHLSEFVTDSDTIGGTDDLLSIGYN
jgi:hypothetical protein